MNFEELQARNGEKTFSINNVMFHSSYNPQREAQSICSKFSYNYIPKYIFLIEPGYSYAYKILKEKFPRTKIGIFRIIDDLKTENLQWDFVININSFNTNKAIQNYLIAHFKEEELLSSLIFCWPSTERLFPEIYQSIYNEFINSLQYAKTILITRQFFENKWIINSFNFFTYLKNPVTLEQNINSPIVITASGPSLDKSLSSLKEFRNKYFLIALSSSVSCLLSNNIIPDLILSTDGGYWAGEHLKMLTKYPEIPIGITNEAYIPKNLLENNLILPLTYKDSCTKPLFNLLNIEDNIVERNGTISGTALLFAKKITKKNIYFIGLELKEQKAFQHARPNQLEINNSISFNKLNSSEKKHFPSSLKSESLEIYRQWFEKLENQKNVFRINEDSNNKKLGFIPDINLNDFCNDLKNATQKTNSFFKKQKKISSVDFTKLKKFYNDIKNDEFFLRQIFPIDFLSIEHSKESEINQAKENLDKKIRKLSERIFKIINDNL